MTGEELDQTLELIDWSARSLARRLNVPEQTVRRMLSDEHEIPDPLAQYLQSIAAVVGSINLAEIY